MRVIISSIFRPASSIILSHFLSRRVLAAAKGTWDLQDDHERVLQVMPIDRLHFLPQSGILSEQRILFFEPNSRHSQLKVRLHACRKQAWIERLGDVIYRPSLEARILILSTVFLSHENYGKVR